jgi:uncharacterized membrane protein
MPHLLKVYLASLPIFLGIDMIWISIISKTFYDKELLGFERTVRIAPAIFVYLLIPLGVLLFAVPKANGNLLHALGWGALFGLIGYGIYDLTNHAIFTSFSLKITLVDILWGMTVCGVTAMIMTWLTKIIK